MNTGDPFDRDVREWLRREGAVDSDDVQLLERSITDLPPRRHGRWPIPAIAAVVGVTVALAGFVIGPRLGEKATSDVSGSVGPTALGTPTSSPTDRVVSSQSPFAGQPQPPDPAAFLGDPRFEACVGTGGNALPALYAFEMPRGRDFLRYLPAMLRSPELERDDGSAFVVILRDPLPPTMIRGGVGEGGPVSPRPREAGHHDICILQGPVVSGNRGYYLDVSIDGFDSDLAAKPPHAPFQATDALLPFYPGTVWTGPDRGIVSRHVIAAYSAPCGQSGSYLQVGWPLGSPSTGFENTRRYLGEPSPAIASDRGYGLQDTYDPSALMPKDATFSGFETLAFQLWTSPTTVDRAMYLRFADHVELWPRSGLWSCS